MKLFFNVLISSIIALVFSVGAFLFSVHDSQIYTLSKITNTEENLGSNTRLFAGFPYYLAGSGVSSSATSITLTSLTIPQTGQKIFDADLDSTFYITLEPGSRERQELVSCTTVTQNSSNGTATLSGCSRGLSPIQPYTASSTLAFAHAGGSSVVFSNPPQVYNDILDYVNQLSLGSTTVSATELQEGIAELATQAEMAASTQFGGSGAALILQSLYATTTPGSAGNWIPITLSTGRLSSDIVPSTYATSTLTIGSFPIYQIGKNMWVSTTTGTTTFSVPSGISKIDVQLCGAGGKGGDGDGIRSGSGGGAGGYARKIVDVTGTSTIQVYVASSTVSTTGESTKFGTNGYYFYATGGGPGTVDAIGGAGGIGVNGDINMYGGDGGMGFSNIGGGSGGASFFGGGGTGGSSNSNGHSGRAMCSGGGGGSYIIYTTGKYGAEGFIMITW